MRESTSQAPAVKGRIGSGVAETEAGLPARPHEVGKMAPARRSAARVRWWRDARRRRMLALADLSAVLLAGAVVVLGLSGSAWVFAFVPLWIVAAKLFGLYDRDHRALRHLTADEVPQITAWAGTITALLVLFLPLTPAETLDGSAAAAYLLTAALAAVAARSIARNIWWRRTPPESVGLIGDGAALAAMRRKFGIFRDMHFELVDEIQIEPLVRSQSRHEDISRIVSGLDRVVVAAGSVDTELIAELNSVCRHRQVKLSVVSPLRGKALPSLHIAQVADLPIFEYNTWDPSRSSLLIKRTFDIMLALAGLLVFVLFLPLIALAIRLDSPGRIFFSQVRAGLGGRPFRMYKLRTMQVGAEMMVDDVVDFDELDEPAFKIEDDPRVTRVGRVLRRFSIDELPQLFNVFVGEMSVVGPRPEQVELVERYSQEDRFRLTVKPGVTGPMQVFGRGELTFEERLAVELEYVENPSLGRDLRILLHTFPAVVRGTGAF